MSFQRSIAITPTSLHTIAVIVMVLWLVSGLFSPSPVPAVPRGDIGWWNSLPSFVRNEGWSNLLFGLLSAIATIYMLAELNVANILLRINSRIISIIFGALICSTPYLHAFQPGLLSMLCILFSYFSLFRSYQMERSSGLIYVSFLYLGIATLTVPKLLWLTPTYWIAFYILQSNNLKSTFASLLGLITPYWLVGGLSYYKGMLPAFWDKLSQFCTFHWGGYTQVPTDAWIIIVLAFLMFIIGTGDFYSRMYMDKNQTRNFYYVIILHGFAFILMFLLQPSLYHALTPLMLISASIMFGHFIANGSSNISNLTVIILSILTLTAYTLNTWIF